MRERKPRRDSERCSIINRTVSFNIADPFQAELLETVDAWTNFSGSVKRLISSSLNGGRVPVQTDARVEKTPETTILNRSDDVIEWDPTELF